MVTHHHNCKLQAICKSQKAVHWLFWRQIESCQAAWKNIIVLRIVWRVIEMLIVDMSVILGWWAMAVPDWMHIIRLAEFDVLRKCWSSTWVPFWDDDRWVCLSHAQGHDQYIWHCKMVLQRFAAFEPVFADFIVVSHALEIDRSFNKGCILV